LLRLGHTRGTCRSLWRNYERAADIRHSGKGHPIIFGFASAATETILALNLRVDEAGDGAFLTVGVISECTVFIGGVATSFRSPSFRDVCLDLKEMHAPARFVLQGSLFDESTSHLLRTYIALEILMEWELSASDFGRIKGLFRLTDLSVSASPVGALKLDLTLHSASKLQIDLQAKAEQKRLTC